MKSKILLFIALVFPFTLLVSCIKQSEVNDFEAIFNQDIAEFELTNHLLNSQKVISFTNIEEFEEVLTYIYTHQDDEDFLIDYINQKYSINCMREIFNEGMLIENESDFLMYVDQFPNVFVKNHIGDSEMYDFPGSNLMSYLFNCSAMLA